MAASKSSMIERVLRLRGVTWSWSDDAPHEARYGAPIGVIAQDVEAVFPELVVTGNDGIRRVLYPGLIAPLAKAITELEARVARLERTP